MQSTLRHSDAAGAAPPPPLHVAIIMDGNGRWAELRGLPRLSGHRAGADAVRRTVEAAVKLRLGTLTLYAFSSDNWRRPAEEVSGLMALFHRWLLTEAERCTENGVRLSVVGRRDRIGPLVAAAIRTAEHVTRGETGLHLRIAIDYSAKDAIVAAAAAVGRRATREQFAEALGRVTGMPGPAPDVDLLVRTGNERRLSDFLLWECAYAELLFTPRMWPDFGEADLAAALVDFRGRERRFGALPRAGTG
jgi:undecaprenyl diphosphate synthase